MIDVLRDIGRSETVHGLRGTFRMWAKGAGIDGTIAEMCLAHEQRSQVEKRTSVRTGTATAPKCSDSGATT